MKGMEAVLKVDYLKLLIILNSNSWLWKNLKKIYITILNMSSSIRLNEISQIKKGR